MVGLAPDFPKMRFRKKIGHQSRNFSLNAEMYRLFFAVNENKTIAQVAAEIDMDLASMRKWLGRLKQLGLVEPMDNREILLDANYIKLVKLNLGYIYGKSINGKVNRAIDKMGYSPAEIPAAQAAKLLQLVSSGLPEAAIEASFQKFMLHLSAYKAKIQQARLDTDRKTALAQQARKKRPPLSTGSRGKIKHLLDAIIAKRSKGDRALASIIRAKFAFQGVDPDAYGFDTPDDPLLLKKLTILAQRSGIQVDNQPPHGAHSHLARPTSYGRIRHIIDAIIDQRSQGDPALAKVIKANLNLRGINPDDYPPNAPDNPQVLSRFKALAKDLGVYLNKIDAFPGTKLPSRGKIKELINSIIQQRARGNPAVAKSLKAKFIRKGINPDIYAHNTPDDPVVLEKVENLAIMLGVIN